MGLRLTRQKSESHISVEIACAVCKNVADYEEHGSKGMILVDRQREFICTKCGAPMFMRTIRTTVDTTIEIVKFKEGDNRELEVFYGA